MIQIQTSNGFLTVDENESFSLNLNVADIKDLSKRKGGYSKTITLIGDDNNIKILGYLFDFDSQNIEIFDRNKKTACSLYSSNNLLFDGYIQLLKVKKINKSSNTHNYTIKFEVQIFDDASSFFSDMAEKELKDLTFEDFNHQFNRDTIINSWSNDYTDGYTYPTMSAPGTDYVLKHYKPALFEYQVFKRIIEQNGYQFSFPEFQHPNIRMDKRIIPFTEAYSDDIFKKIANDYRVNVSNTGVQTRVNNTRYHKALEINGSEYNPFRWIMPMKYFTTNMGLNSYTTMFSLNLPTVIDDPKNQYSTPNVISPSDEITEPHNWEYRVTYTAKLEMRGMDRDTGTPTSWIRYYDDGSSTPSLPLQYRNRMDLKVSTMIMKDGNINTHQYVDETVVFSFPYQTSQDTVPYSSGDWIQFGDEFTSTRTMVYTGINPPQSMRINARVFGDYYYKTLSSGVETKHQNFNTDLLEPNITRFQAYNQFVKYGTATPIYLETRITITDIQVEAVPVLTGIPINANIQMIDFTPSKVKQKDVFMDVLKSYNLFVIPDNKKLSIITRDEYYDSGELLDLTDRFCEDKEHTMEFVSTNLNKSQEFRYSRDEDVINKRYQDSFDEPFGTASFDLDNEYARNEDITELKYCPTPNLKTDLNITLPSIDNYDDKAKYKMRILLNNGIKTTSGNYNFYNSNTFTGSIPLITNQYLHTSMFDSDSIPTFSICWDVPKTYFHNDNQQSTLNNLFYLHYARTFKQINEGRILTGYFRLDEDLIYKFSKNLNYNIYIKDFGYFNINKVIDYNPNSAYTKMELITADRELKVKPPLIPVKPVKPPLIPGVPAPVEPVFPIGGTVRPVIEAVDAAKRDFASGTNIGGGMNIINGMYNEIYSRNTTVNGDKNHISNDSDYTVAFGNKNTILNNNRNFIYGNNITVKPNDEESFYVRSNNLDLNGIIIKPTGIQIGETVYGNTGQTFSMKYVSSGYVESGYTIEEELFVGYEYDSVSKESTYLIEADNLELNVHNINIMNIPSSDTGLNSGDLWRDGDIIKIKI